MNKTQRSSFLHTSFIPQYLPIEDDTDDYEPLIKPIPFQKPVKTNHVQANTLLINIKNLLERLCMKIKAFRYEERIMNMHRRALEKLEEVENETKY